MATTVYFEQTIADEGRVHDPIKLELGTMTGLRNGGNLYLRFNDGDPVLVDKQTAALLREKLGDALAFLGICSDELAKGWQQHGREVE